jgi:SIR2-like domain
MSIAEDWDNQDLLLDMLAQRLLRKRLSLCLGAGASMAFNLPNWTTLVDNLYEISGQPPSTSKSDTERSEEVFAAKYNGDRLRFARDVQRALYQDYVHDPVAVDSNHLLSAIGALVMSSARGSVSQVITLNYDNILENHLERRGFTVSSLAKLPSWDSDADIEVLHPHGLLDVDQAVIPSSGIVLTELDYNAIVGNVGDLWRQKITGILRSTTCIFIGLSGADQNLMNQLYEVNQKHTVTGSEPFWGVRLGRDEGRPWRTRGVYSAQLASHNDIPSFILEICRRAAVMRTRRNN